MRYTPLTATEFATIDGLEDWRFVLGAIHAEFRTGSFPAAAGLVAAIAEVAEASDHHPDLAVRYPDRVRVTLTTHAIHGLSDVDVEVARTISVVAQQAGATSEPRTPQVLELAIDTMDADAIRPFWAAVMGYRERNGSLVDPLGHGPGIWFQEMTEPRPQRNRIHFDISVSHDEADARVAAALAAGGTLVSAEFARSWWVLADADGNEICVCTWQDRD
ncbi:MAG: 4a-hydroxytetrahydrobiopterin dehydratase [Actinobacteria bacterium]|nr:4a-hydroxytetrahydrobiopterin dehydratase [Actinomycetota bacterium]